MARVAFRYQMQLMDEEKWYIVDSHNASAKLEKGLKTMGLTDLFPSSNYLL